MLVMICQQSITVPLPSTVCNLEPYSFQHSSASSTGFSWSNNQGRAIYPVYLQDGRHTFTRRLIDEEAGREPFAFNQLCLCLCCVQQCSRIPQSQEYSYTKEKQDKSRIRSDKSQASIAVNRLKEIDRSAWDAT